MIELTTQCPQCRYCSDVTLAQLQQRKGLLRCEQCAHIFDAYECVVTNQVVMPKPVALAKPTVLAKRASHLRTHFIGSAPSAMGLVMPSVINRPVRQPSQISSPQPIQTLIRDGGTDSYHDIRVYLNKHEVHSPSSPPISAVPPPHRALPVTPKLHSKAEKSSLLNVLFLLLFIAILLQLIYIYRVQIANIAPFTRPTLQWMCHNMDCDLPYSREINAIEIRQSSLLQQPFSANSDAYEYQLQLQLKNNLTWPQEWPTLVLSFSDAAAAGMATIALSPEQYLLPHQKGLPFDAGAQQVIRVPITVPNKKINGFSVEKYYP